MKNNGQLSVSREVSLIEEDTLRERTQRIEIGKGRSGTVFRSSDANNNDAAIKVFTGADSLTKLVNYVLTGAPNAYGWNENAAKCAHLRREILSTLLPYWFESHVKVAGSLGTGWNAEAKAYELRTEFIHGRHASLQHPFSKGTDWEYRDLVHNVMKPLQEKLIESGFDGLVWQAGKGNPTGLKNFMLENESKWVWIDAESGVPALFPLDPTALVSFYLPNSIKRGRALFDDVDTGKLRSYVEKNRPDLEQKIGKTRLRQFESDIDQLHNYQEEWKALRRASKSVMYHFKKGHLTQEQADWYYKHPLAWYGRESVRIARRGIVALGYDIPVKVIQRLKAIHYWRTIKNAAKFVLSGTYRKTCIEKFVNGRIQEWQDRGQLRAAEADYLREQVEHESGSPYLTDFLVIMGLKPIVKGIEIFVLPSMYAMQIIDEATLALGISLGGALSRTSYTLGRMLLDRVRAHTRGKHPRLIALLVGAVPTIGSTGYPVQMIYNASSKSKELAEFLTYDIATRVGGKIPIWGGQDTSIEHFFNQIPTLLLRKRKRTTDLALLPGSQNTSPTLSRVTE